MSAIEVGVTGGSWEGQGGEALNRTKIVRLTFHMEALVAQTALTHRPFPTDPSLERERVRESSSHTLSLAGTGIGNGGKLPEIAVSNRPVPEHGGNEKCRNINSLVFPFPRSRSFPGMDGNGRFPPILCFSKI